MITSKNKLPENFNLFMLVFLNHQQLIGHLKKKKKKGELPNI
jgi:hypothetical protein